MASKYRTPWCVAGQHERCVGVVVNGANKPPTYCHCKDCKKLASHTPSVDRVTTTPTPEDMQCSDAA